MIAVAKFIVVLSHKRNASIVENLLRNGISNIPVTFVLKVILHVYFMYIYSLI